MTIGVTPKFARVRDQLIKDIGCVAGEAALETDRDMFGVLGLHCAMAGITAAASLYAASMSLPIENDIVRTIRPFIIEMIALSSKSGEQISVISCGEIQDRMESALEKYMR